MQLFLAIVIIIDLIANLVSEEDIFNIINDN